MSEILGSKTSMKINVIRRSAELVPPAKPTPYEYKQLSELDTVEDFQFHAYLIQVYRNNRPTDQHRDGPAKVIKEAVAKALVPYYPLAGRLRPSIGRRMVVECNGEGIMFIEADADFTVDEFRHPLYHPFCFNELVYDVPGSNGNRQCPLILIQVTRLKCGGFIFGLRLNHTMADGIGITKFLSAIAELAHGAKLSSIKPVWKRELLTSQNSLQSRSDNVHDKNNSFEINEDSSKENNMQFDDMVCKYFFFGSSEIDALRSSIPSSGSSFTKSELIAAHLWRSRTIALSNDPNEVFHFRFVINIMPLLNPPLPAAYYGNVIVVPTVETTARQIAENPFQYTLELVTSLKLKVNEEYVKSLADRIVSNGHYEMIRNKNGFVVSDLTRLGLDQLDYGWGKPVSVSVQGGNNHTGGLITFLVPYTNFDEVGVLAPIFLPRHAMDKFVNIVWQFNTSSKL